MLLKFDCRRRERLSSFFHRRSRGMVRTCKRAHPRRYYGLHGDLPPASELFAVLALMRISTLPLSFMSLFLSTTYQMLVAFKRLEKCRSS